MENLIYIQLLDEGVTVFRPVSATIIGGKIYKINNNSDIYKPEDEIWEFLPGDIVEVDEKILDDGVILVAKKRLGP